MGTESFYLKVSFKLQYDKKPLRSILGAILNNHSKYDLTQWLNFDLTSKDNFIFRVQFQNNDLTQRQFDSQTKQPPAHDINW